MNLLLLAASTLPRGGVIAPSWGPGLEVTAKGPGARIDGDLTKQLSPALGIDEINPKTVQAAFTAALATRLGQAIEYDATAADTVSFVVVPLKP